MVADFAPVFTGFCGLTEIHRGASDWATMKMARRRFIMIACAACFASASAQCDPMAFDPSICEYPLLDTDVSWRIDAAHELMSVAWGIKDGMSVLAAGDIDGDLYLWETGHFYLHPTRWNMISGYTTNNEVPPGDPFPRPVVNSVNKVAYDETIQQMVWSPDGTKIAITSGYRGTFASDLGQLTVFDTNTMSLVDPTLLPHGCEFNGYHWVGAGRSTPRQRGRTRMSRTIPTTSRPKFACRF